MRTSVIAIVGGLAAGVVLNVATLLWTPERVRDWAAAHGVHAVNDSYPHPERKHS